MQPVSPVVPGLEPYEIVLAKDQPGYLPLPMLRGPGPMHLMLSRWKLTDEEKQQILNGSDIYLTQLTFGHPFQPTSLVVARAEASGKVCEDIVKHFGFDTELDERLRKFFKNSC
jgi:hypothetical protein